LNKCLAALAPQKVPGAQLKEILQIQFQTPNFGGNGNDWAMAIAGGQFPLHQGFWNAIPAGKGITVDNTQPYPVLGWIEVGYAVPEPVTTLGGATAPVSDPQTNPVIAHPVTVHPPVLTPPVHPPTPGPAVPGSRL
jgi:hypothetical protein